MSIIGLIVRADSLQNKQHFRDAWGYIKVQVAIYYFTAPAVSAKCCGNKIVKGERVGVLCMLALSNFVSWSLARLTINFSEWSGAVCSGFRLRLFVILLQQR